MELKIGHCVNCDKSIIGDKKLPKKERLKEYRETILELSNGTIMRVAICQKCLKKLNQKMAEKIIVRHNEYWKREDKKFKDLDLIKFNVNEKKFIKDKKLKKEEKLKVNKK